VGKKLAQDHTTCKINNKDIPADERSGTSEDNTAALNQSPNRWGTDKSKLLKVKLLDKIKGKSIYLLMERMTIV
jgi:hypothetical protein